MSARLVKRLMTRTSCQEPGWDFVPRTGIPNKWLHESTPNQSVKEWISLDHEWRGANEEKTFILTWSWEMCG